MKRTIVISSLIFLLLSFGCRLEYDQREETDAIPESIPDSILFDFEHISVSDGQPVFSIRAEMAETYNKKKQTILKNVSFTEFDSNLEAATTGSASSAILFADTEDAELEGDIVAWSSREKAEIKTSYLFWHNKERMLVSKPEEEVKVSQETGTEITGKGFSADIGKMEISFTEGAEGTLVTPEEDE